jgi:hypothetical protein
MISVSVSRRLVSIEFLPEGQTNKSHFFTETVLLSIDRKLGDTSRKCARQQLTWKLTILNRQAKASVQKIQELGFIRVRYPPDSSTIALCDFLFFGSPKQKFGGLAPGESGDRNV